MLALVAFTASFPLGEQTPVQVEAAAGVTAKAVVTVVVVKAIVTTNKSAVCYIDN